MSAPASMPSGSPPPTAGAAFRPTVLATLSGLWLLTWKSRFSVRQWPAIAGAILPASLLALLVLRTGTNEAYDFFYWLTTAYLLLGVPLYCLAVFGGLVRDELQSNTLSFLMTRPMSRARFLLLRFVCQLAWVQVIGLAAGLLLLGTGFGCGVPGVPRFAGLFLSLQAVALAVFGALATLFGLVHRRYLVLGTIYGLVVEVGIGQIPTNINTLAMTRHLRSLLAYDHELARIYPWTTEAAGTALLVLPAAALVFLALSAAMFTLREYTTTGETMQ
jgi:ABC-type transport system involved in multi-copper enzyme maturation permease subunit